MKKLICLLILPLLTVVTRVQSDCTRKDAETQNCLNLHLEPDQPVQIKVECPSSENNCKPFIKLILTRPEGAIGRQTFSALPHLEEISIIDGKFSHIEDGALCSSPNLQSLVIQNTALPVLTESFFSKCENIKSLTLHTVQMLPNALKSMTGLENLHLISQNITHLHKDYFDSFKNLKLLDLSRCNIEDIEDGFICSPPKLETLYLSFNTISVPLTKSTFHNCANIQEFRYITSQETYLEENALTGLINVKTALLDFLDVGILKKEHLAGLTNPETLSVIRSKITKIDSNCFNDFKHLKDLRLYFNKITEFDSDVISGLPNLVKLNLQQNDLASIDNLKHPKLEELDVISNYIPTIAAGTVKVNLPNLKKLKIAYNPMTSEYETSLKGSMQGVTIIGKTDIEPGV